MIWKFRGADLMHISLREFADPVERILQLLLIAIEVFIAGIRRNWDQFAEAHQDAGKRLGG